MAEKDCILEIDHLQTQFKIGKRRVYAVNDVCLTLNRGEILGIVGESGCGKSITAHSILQLLPKSGNIVGGSITYYPEKGKAIKLTDLKRNSREMRALRGKDISMIFQDPLSSLDPVYCIGKQIGENLHNHEKISKKDAHERIVKMLTSLGIPSPEDRYYAYPHELSGGMKQRIMIATAMICNPNILIADEPTTALDVTIQGQILSLMKKLQAEYGTSIIMITHNMGIIAEVCEKVAVMYMGRVVEFGELRQIFHNPKHPYTQALLKSVPVLGMDKNKELATINGSTPDASIRFDGCEFAGRCPYATEACKLSHPERVTIEEGHTVCCHLYKGGN